MATTTKTGPQMRGITPRHPLRALERVDVTSGVYRVSRRRGVLLGDDRVSSFPGHDGGHRIVPEDLREVPYLRQGEPGVPESPAGAFTRVDFGRGEECSSMAELAASLHRLLAGEGVRGAGPL